MLESGEAGQNKNIFGSKSLKEKEINATGKILEGQKQFAPLLTNTSLQFIGLSNLTLLKILTPYLNQQKLRKSSSSACMNLHL